MMSAALPLLATNFAILIAVILVLWRISVRIRDVSFIDAFWAAGMVILSWSSWFQTGNNAPASLLILGLVTLWGIRLSTHLYTRWRAMGIDPRYPKIMGGVMEARGWSWSKTALVMVFLMQAPLLFITCLPAQLGIMAGGELNRLAYAGAAIAMAGIAFESIGDAQLTAFRANPENKGKVLDTGLWRYTRHPNYFGDFCTWWGIWLITVSSHVEIAAATVIGPLFLSFTLMKWSGAPLLERGLKKNRPGYANYIARTSAFFPWPPRRL